MTALTTLLCDMGRPGRDGPAAARWLSDWLPDAMIVTLAADDLARLDSYRGRAEDLHELLDALPVLPKPVWIEAAVTAQGGTEMTMGYGAVPMGDGIDIGWACHAPALGRLIGPLGPALVTPRGIERPHNISDESWRELRSAAGVVLRVLLFFTPEAAAP